MTKQEINERILLQLWRMGEELFAPIERMVTVAEKASYILPCELAVNGGYDRCGRDAVVFDLESECVMCSAHFWRQA